MKDRITWVPSLLTGELIPKKTSVWDLDDKENEERNDRRQASLMETTPYSRPKNYEANIRIFQPPITPGSVLPYPFNRIMQNMEKRIPQKNPTKQTQTQYGKFNLPITAPNAPRDSISDPDFLRIIEPYLTPNPTGLSADTLRSISRSDKDIEYGTVVRQYNTSGNGHSLELKADPITKGQAPYVKNGFLYHPWNGDMDNLPDTETTGFIHTHPGPRPSSPSPGDMWIFAESQKDRKNTNNSLMATFTPDTEYYITIEDQKKIMSKEGEEALKNAHRDFLIDQKKHKPQEQNFIQRYLKNEGLKGVFGIYRRCYRNGKLDGFEKAVLDENGEYRWKPIKGQYNIVPKTSFE